MVKDSVSLERSIKAALRRGSLASRKLGLSAMFVDTSRIELLHVIFKEFKFLVFYMLTTFQEHGLMDLIRVKESEQLLQSA